MSLLRLGCFDRMEGPWRKSYGVGSEMMEREGSSTSSSPLDEDEVLADSEAAVSERMRLSCCPLIYCSRNATISACLCFLASLRGVLFRPAVETFTPMDLC